MGDYHSPAEKHYIRERLFGSILDSLHNQGIVHPARKDLSGVDQFHVTKIPDSKSIIQFTFYSFTTYHLLKCVCY